MNIFTVDACAVIAYLFDEPGSDLFENMLVQARRNEIELVMHAANLGEVYYDILKRNDVQAAQVSYQTVKQFPIRFEDRISDQLIFRIGELKIGHRISYADAFAVAQTNLLNATLITTDHKEFEPLEKAGVVTICWLR